MIYGEEKFAYTEVEGIISACVIIKCRIIRTGPIRSGLVRPGPQIICCRDAKEFVPGPNAFFLFNFKVFYLVLTGFYYWKPCASSFTHGIILMHETGSWCKNIRDRCPIGHKCGGAPSFVRLGGQFLSL